MADVLTLLSFHPGHPILIGIGVLAALGYLVAGVPILLYAPRRMKLVWFVGVVLLAAEVADTVWVQSQIEWNPQIAMAEVTGTWVDGQHELALRGDGTFKARATRGHWALQGPALLLMPEPAGFHAPWFLRFGPQLRLLPETGDPDDWAGELGLHREGY